MKRNSKNGTPSANSSEKSKQQASPRLSSSKPAAGEASIRRSSRWRLLFYFLTALIVVGGFVYWQSELVKDPPMYLAGIGQSLSTDPAQYVYHARNKILFGDWDPFAYGRWAVYRHSIVSAVSYAWMLLTEVDIRNANMTGVLLSFGALIFMLLGVLRHHRAWVAAAVAFAFVVNVTLLTHGRLSYLEDGLMFWAAGMFFVYSWWGDRLRGIIVAGAIVAAAALTGKLFGALLAPALMLAVFFDNHPRRWLRAAVGGIAFGAAFLILLPILYGGDLGAAFAYTGEQSYGLRGFPDGLKSPWAFFEHLVSYGFDNRLFYLNPEILLMLVVAGLLALRFRLDYDRLAPTTRLALFWSVCGIIGLMPLNYSPIRYTLLFIPAIIVFGLTMFDQTAGARVRPRAEHGRWSLGLLVVLLWPALFHLIGNLFYLNTFPRPIRSLTWIAFVIAVVGALGLQALLKRPAPARQPRLWLTTLVVVLMVTAGINAERIHRLHVQEQNFSIAEANTDLAAILAPGAVVSGPYGPVLTLETARQSFIHLFQVAEVDSSLFADYPITHLIMDASNYNEAIRNYPALAGLQPITHYFIRDIEVGVYRIDSGFGNPTAEAYAPSYFERAVAYLQADQVDSALALAVPQYEIHPESKSIGLLVAELQMRAGNVEGVYNILMNLSRRFPTDFSIQLQTGRFLLLVALQQKDPGLRATAERYFAEAVRLNQYRAQHAMSIWSHMLSSPGASGSRP